MAFQSAATLKKSSGQDGDVKIPSPPNDCISSVSLNGTQQTPSNLLAVTAWDNTVSCYEIQYTQQGTIAAVNPHSQIRQDAPVLCSDINTVDNSTVFTGSADNHVKAWNVAQGSTAVRSIGTHNAPVKTIKFIPEKQLLFTGSWDKTVKVWDLRSPQPTATLAVDDRVYCLDARGGQALVVCMAGRKISIFDMTAGNKVADFLSPMQYQTRCCAMFADLKGFAMGSIEGRVALEYFDELHLKNKPAQSNAPKPKSFAFKCHRDGADIFPINAVHFHGKNTFLSAGGDGTIVTWDKDVRHRLTSLENFKRQAPIVDAKFSAMGHLMAYAVSYDWSRGAEGYDPKLGHNVFIHVIKPEDVDPKDPRTLPAATSKR